MRLPDFSIATHSASFDIGLQSWAQQHGLLLDISTYKTGQQRYCLRQSAELLLEIETLPVTPERLRVAVAFPDPRDAALCLIFLEWVSDVYGIDLSRAIQIARKVHLRVALAAQLTAGPVGDPAQRATLPELNASLQEGLPPIIVKEATPQQMHGQNQSGRPGLEHENYDEFIQRLALAQEAEEFKVGNPALTWKQIARVIMWPPGDSDSGIKTLATARKRLKSAKASALNDVQQWRKEKKEKN